MNILGIDPGTTKTGITHITGTPKKPKFDVDLIGYDCLPTETPKIDDRLLYILPLLIERIEKIRPELVIYEYPFNVKGNGRVLLEFIGVFRYHCIKNGIPYIPLQQQRIKKYATGKGNVEKSDLRMRIFTEYGIDLSEDRSDAFWIGHFGMGYLYPEALDKQFRIDSINAMKTPKIKKAFVPKPDQPKNSPDKKELAKLIRKAAAWDARKAGKKRKRETI